MRGRRAGVLIGLLLMAPCVAHAQTDFQVWGNLTFDWVKSDHLVYELDLEPKVLVNPSEGEPDWRNLDMTPNAEYSPNGWIDLVSEATIGYTRQTDAVNTIELSPRVGVRFHLFSRGLPTVIDGLERPPTRRIVIRDLVRFESRNLIYTGAGSGSSNTFRFRNRLEFLMPLNKEKLTDDRVRYLLADWEWYAPRGEPDERYANKQRVRVGLAYRRSFSWRYQLLYIVDRSRNTIEDGFTTTTQCIDVQVKRVF